MSNANTFDTGRRRPLFTFAVIADTHVNPIDGESSSPWEANRLANARTRAVAAHLATLDIAFVVHLGDMVHPVPAQPGYAQAADRFREAFARIVVPLHLIPGNHDIGDKPTPWTPAAPITAASLRAYRNQFGMDRHAFEHGGCRFVLMNSELLNAGTEEEAQQWAWLERELVPGRRTFLFKHYPLFICDPAEAEHYDNIAEPARARLIALIGKAGVEAVFAGHVHNLFYDRIGATDAYVLPTVSAVRHDYMELFAVPPPAAAEFGRNARSKLGFFLVDVHEDGHVAHWVRTWGATEPAAIPARTAKSPSVRAGRCAPLGVDLRYAWAEPAIIPHTGVVDEFGRKRARNDYLLASLWELGLARLRVPLQDVVEQGAAERMCDLGALGHRFTVFSFGVPDTRARALIARHVPHLDALEIVVEAAKVRGMVAHAAALRAELGVAVFMSRLHVTADVDHGGAQLAHFILHGFKTDEVSATDILSHASGIDGLSFRIDPDESVWETLESISAAMGKTSLRALAHVRMTAGGPAREISDDAVVARRVTDAMLASWRHAGRVGVFLDTFADHDRGYFPRHGLTDRRYDPRPAGSLIAKLVSRFAGIDWRETTIEGSHALRLVRLGRQPLAIVVVEPSWIADAAQRSMLAPLGPRALAGSRLDTGEPVKATIGADGNLALGSASDAGMPLILELS